MDTENYNNVYRAVGVYESLIFQVLGNHVNSGNLAISHQLNSEEGGCQNRYLKSKTAKILIEDANCLLQKKNYSGALGR